MANKKHIQKKSEPDHRSTSTVVERSPFWFYIIMFLIPVLLLVMLEISLRLFNYGLDLTQWVPVNNTGQILNPQIAAKYFFTTKNIPQSNQTVFDINKKPDCFRVFILGESSAAGYPYIPNGSFSNYLQKRLELVYPDKTIEVINVSISAINSFTMRDLMPGIIEQKPDLIIFYAGHNEYYGALGVGSMESIGSSRNVVNLILWLNKFKTVELLRNTIKAVMNLFTVQETKPAGTLMSQMAKEQSIPLNSDKFIAGLEQFEGNMKDMLEMTTKAHVPVLFGTLACNLKDQKPFISLKYNDLPLASDIYNSAIGELKNKEYSKAEELFRYAKDLDVLRFRAPGKINTIIKKLSKEYGCSYVDIDSAFNQVSPDGIVGNNLMTDHLHPTLDGYRFIGKLYFDKMRNMNLITGNGINLSDKVQDSLAIRNVHFSELDSVIGRFRIVLLKNDWPYVDKKDRKDPLTLFNLDTSIDSIAFQVVDGNLSWEKAHREAALRYLSKNQLAEFSREVFVMAEEYPFVVEYHQFAAKQLVARKQYDLAMPHLYEQDKLYPDAFTSKWIGNISLFRSKPDEAIRYLSRSLMFNSRDGQVLYNLAGAYSMKKEYSKALETINRSLLINPNDPAARALKAQLQNH